MRDLGTLESPAPIAFLVPAPVRATVGAARADARPRPPPGCRQRRQRPAQRRGIRLHPGDRARRARRRSGRPRSLRAGMGAHFGLRLVEGADDAIARRARRSRVRHQLARRAAPRRIALPWPCAWVFGHEGQGVADGVARRAGPCSPSPSRAAANRSTSPPPPRSACTRRHASTAAERRGGSVTTTMGELSIRPARVRQEDSSRGRASARPLHDFRRLPCDS